MRIVYTCQVICTHFTMICKLYLKYELVMFIRLWTSSFELKHHGSWPFVCLLFFYCFVFCLFFVLFLFVFVLFCHQIHSVHQSINGSILHVLQKCSSVSGTYTGMCIRVLTGGSQAMRTCSQYTFIARNSQKIVRLLTWIFVFWGSRPISNFEHVGVL